MSLSKKYLKTKPICKVTFKLPKDESKQANVALLSGDFNNWQPAPMKKLKSGDFTLTLDLDKDQAYQFRYLLDEQTWENDWQADAYLPSPLSYEDNSVVIV
ncbi:isoamylase early set domain-containing protein [Psychrosphaera sp. F3M07]|jgi:1,4-alpha-glucan branching enzyme|uniref:Isoamylase early set domain-containing protein n=1 Tax=Psychrosphaera aquimarina TaxID=2044854 RepID=A0ABU3R5I1_9GAMM|nr:MULTISPECIES: isoamylase early set domain-containing protein [Psychrosphaera]MBU2916537.1 isoamylase early set domain-containing protein [Psychrosphaera sp. F3M07]MDU0114725.1 isoamylase early set domain-containing protein [Psychrosphaera aquimarina]